MSETRREIVEYGVRLPEGGLFLRTPDQEAGHSIAEWLRDMASMRSTVIRRRITVVEDWVEIVGESAPLKPVERPRRSVFDTGDVEAYWHSRNNREG